MKALNAINIPVAKLIPSEWNRQPPSAAKLKQLADQMLSARQLVNPLHVWLRDDGNYDVWCGHSRRLAAIDIGWAYVPCIVHDRRELKKGETVESLRGIIVRAEGEGRAAVHEDQLRMYVLSGKTILPSSKQLAVDIKLTEQMFGPDGCAWLLANKAPARTCRMAVAVHRCMTSKGKGAAAAPVPSPEDIARWLVTHKGLSVFHYMGRNGWPVKALDVWRSRIRLNQPFSKDEAAGRV